MERLHEGAKILLAHFHYTNKGVHPFTIDWTSPDQIDRSQFNAEQAQFMRETVAEINKKGWTRLNPLPIATLSPLGSPLSSQTGTNTLFGMAEERFREVRQKEEFEHDYYFISQLYDRDWKPVSTV